MEFFVKPTFLISLALQLFISGSEIVADSSPTSLPFPVYNEKNYIYLLMVPDYDLERLTARRLRQDEEEGTINFAQTGVLIGQIISGVLNFDSKPVFSGTVGFVEDPTAQKNLGSFFGTIAPAMNLVLKEMYNRAQIAFGFGTTPKPVPTPLPSDAILKNGTRTPTKQNSTPVSGIVKSNVTKLTDGDDYSPLTAEEQTEALEETTTTVPPLPFLRFRTSTPSEDDEGDDGKYRLYQFE